MRQRPEVVRRSQTRKFHDQPVQKPPTIMPATITMWGVAQDLSRVDRYSKKGRNADVLGTSVLQGFVHREAESSRRLSWHREILPLLPVHYLRKAAADFELFQFYEVITETIAERLRKHARSRKAAIASTSVRLRNDHEPAPS